MSKSYHPFDHLFKAGFQVQIIARSFMEIFFPKELVENLDLNKLHLDTSDYISPKLKEYFSDVVYRCPYGKEEVIISLLFEHKSSPPGYPFLQLLRYMMEIWERNEKNGKPLQMIIPIIVYHGRKKWNKKPVPAYFKGVDKGVEKYIPQFDYILTDLADWSDGKLEEVQQVLLRHTLILLKHYRDSDYFRKHLIQLLTQLEGFTKDSKFRNLITTMLVYITETTDITEEEFTYMIKEAPQTIKNKTMTLYQNILKKGELKGEKRGEKKGEKKNQETVIRNGVSKGYDDQTISDLTGLSIKEVKTLIQKLNLR